ncbi:L-aminoadipate-semialdehyde dehydrogenase-phosphopantetheinyl transferase [Hylaeus anthracinus]|uniref:L-aminoadipate-semialdehyde dehydrogenase-phosphopantetheinyl transferase n=1 Tax=Hylaeus anthracinus TaxID=313031 RepID=UPI0023B8A889|nr:L-aminoadipate-semialdehyde dehydrogenase-phosphopantetheinyl transferase [Hylaeus anthracinus]XP_054007945.1 L-aminoadipate-semialdehyde dehydrogenase-phosphopantetheinyl transferase [Hylaeus anthracinus]
MKLVDKINFIKMFESIRWAFNWKEWNPSEKDIARAISCVQLDEKERLDRFVFRKDVRSSLVGRLMMRKYVNDYGHIPYNEIVFARDTHNKPIVRNASLNLRFNVSHQGNYTVLAGETRDVKLGVDVMKLEYTGGKQLSEFFRIMGRICSSSEWDEIKNTSLNDSEQIHMFCRHWALKESYGKATGKGITIDLGSLNFRTNSKLVDNSVITDTVLYIHDVKQDWLFEETLLDSEHCVAVALQENGTAPPSRHTCFEILSSDRLFANTIPLFPQDSEFAKKYLKKVECP